MYFSSSWCWISSFVCGAANGTKFSGMDQVKFFKGCLPQILLGPFLNTLSQMLILLLLLAFPLPIADFYPLDTGSKLNVDKTFRTSSEHLMYVQFTSCAQTFRTCSEHLLYVQFTSCAQDVLISIFSDEVLRWSR